MNKPSRIVPPFVIGLRAGGPGRVFLPGYVRPYLPEWVMGKATVGQGDRGAKQKKETALLLTVNTSKARCWPRSPRRWTRFALLVNEKDVIEFTLQKYAPLSTIRGSHAS